VRVLLTGGGGFIGRHVLASLRHPGVEVLALGRTRPPGLAVESFAGADLLADDPLPDAIARFAPTHLIHLAWVTGHGAYWSSPDNARWACATTRLVQAFHDAGGRHVVVAGTCAEYDVARGLCREDSTPLEPSTPYGVAKDATRRRVAAACAARGVSCAWARIFLVHGAGEDARRLVPSLAAALTGTSPPFAVNLPAWRDFLHASDVAEGLVALARHGADGAYNVSSGEPVRLREIVTRVAALLGADPSPILDLGAAARPGEPPLLAGESLRLRALGWRPRLSLADGLARTLESRRAETGAPLPH